ncbi:MAG: SpaH/EbpB family LPXTG-anchored major pilin [Bifidobacterium aquikefiri]|uniref:Fimbrial isopeptide formation D2 domain-containing protein n=1 Tax=Bifidobacterium aquikefiri TaxID=1653207 RepID=A0A261GAS0_9BIFI|nr:SpaH/EbpB family LPXTG-anchored major pilin [Bifidobacterium aquikefiri]OZG68518.1 fimbrial isopeptide formation D2 domain-containing protein [Bifidobacterium aquikefiri]
MKHHSQPSVIKALAVSLVCTAVGAFGFVSTANATEANTGNLNPNTKGTVTIHKYSESVNKGSAASGHEDASQVPAGAQPLANVVFTAYQITNIDLMTNAGWDAAATLAPGSFTVDTTAKTLTAGAASYTLGTGTALPATNSSGLAVSPSLSLGAYVFVETIPDGSNIVSSQPFVVTVPLPDSDGSWNYNIHVYPKNSITALSKDVNDANAYKVGDTIAWPIKLSLPYLPSGKSFDTVEVYDTLDDALTYSGVVVTQGATTFVQGTDYTVVQAGQKVTVTFTPVGRAKLTQGTDVTFTLSTTVNSSLAADADGIIYNQAFANVNDGKNIPSNKPHSDWGWLTLEKYAEGKSEKSLAGAKFDVKNAAGDVVTALTTDADGNAGPIALKVGNYTLVETAAPAGYELSTDPIAVTIVAGGKSSAKVVKIANKQKPPVKLPLSGGTGTVIFTITGLTLVGAATALTIRSRRKVAQASSLR